MEVKDRLQSRPPEGKGVDDDGPIALLKNKEGRVRLIVYKFVNAIVILLRRYCL